MSLRMLKVLELFAGIGGFSLGLESAGGFKTAAFCEIDESCHRVLRKNWPGVPIFPDVTKLSAEELERRGVLVDVIVGGFPCQDISNAGNMAGIDGSRSGLWSEYARLIGEIRPQFAIVENVPALIVRGLGRVLGDLAQVGYDAEWRIIGARDLGAHHIRERLWILAYPDSSQRRRSGMPVGVPPPLAKPNVRSDTRGSGSVLADANRVRLQGPGEPLDASRTAPILNWKTMQPLYGGVAGIWKTEPDLGRVANGVPRRSHRLRQLGNAVCPPVVELIGRAILRSQIT
jgi:DNA (cytosine-5)-methyltransferase 1